MTATPSRRVSSFELRLYFHALSGRAFFYIPVLVLHVQDRLAAAGVEQANAATMGVLAFFAVGIAVAEYPSGVFADWAGRSRSLVVGSVLYAFASLLLWWDGPLWLLALSQLLLGVASAFRSGADTALLYSSLSARGALDRYPGALAMLRFANLAGLTLAAGLGGLLWSWHPASVFWATFVAVLIGALPLLGMPDERLAPAHPNYWALLRDSLGVLRRSRDIQLLVGIGGTGATYFVFSYWAVQAFLVEQDAAPWILGQVTMVVTLLQASTMPLSSRLARWRADSSLPFFVLLLGLTAAFGVVAVASRQTLPVLGAASIVVAAAFAPLFRNLVNVRLQPLVSDGVRASVLSLETWLGNLYYAAFFPLAGWLLDLWGPTAGYAGIGGIVAVTSVPLLIAMATRRR